VGAEPSERFAPAVHQIPMLSLANAFDPEEVREFDRRVRRLLGTPETARVEYSAEPKTDGLAVELVYERGAFAVGATRGDGVTGEDGGPVSGALLCDCIRGRSSIRWKTKQASLRIIFFRGRIERETSQRIQRCPDAKPGCRDAAAPSADRRFFTTAG
jgi:hypothetical protein